MRHGRGGGCDDRDGVPCEADWLDRAQHVGHCDGRLVEHTLQQAGSALERRNPAKERELRMGAASDPKGTLHGEWQGASLPKRARVEGQGDKEEP